MANPFEGLQKSEDADALLGFSAAFMKSPYAAAAMIAAGHVAVRATENTLQKFWWDK